MRTYTPLFNTLVKSSVWCGTTKEVKILWITLLALKDADGVVHASLPGLAKDAELTLAETEKALAALEAPDPYTITQEYQGRRIERVEGGWRVLNHGKYRDAIQRIRSDNAARQREHRRRNREKLQSQYPPSQNKPQASERVATRFNDYTGE